MQMGEGYEHFRAVPYPLAISRKKPGKLSAAAENLLGLKNLLDYLELCSSDSQHWLLK